MAVKRQTGKKGDKGEFFTALGSCLTLRSNELYLRVGRLDAVGILCIGLVGGLADGEELEPCFMTERGISGTMQVTGLRPQGVDRAARLPVAEVTSR